MTLAKKLQIIFWVCLVSFLGWDFYHSDPVDFRLDPPVIAAGSGQASTGGHCSIAK
ncbi:MAG: hypothetical protein NWS57_01050 [Burkholderiaceae bacterium]|jgi:hypothetical protein|nr:hypothetical protein [Burkholderiaceae bacterium]